MENDEKKAGKKMDDGNQIKSEGGRQFTSSSLPMSNPLPNMLAPSLQPSLNHNQLLQQPLFFVSPSAPTQINPIFQHNGMLSLNKRKRELPQELHDSLDNLGTNNRSLEAEKVTKRKEYKRRVEKKRRVALQHNFRRLAELLELPKGPRSEKLSILRAAVVELERYKNIQPTTEQPQQEQA